MKKFVFLLVVCAVVLGIYSEDQFLWCKKLFMNEPAKHVIQKGEYFSKLSQRYYGSAEYWRELALVNRAPDSDLVFPGEEIVIPSIDAVRRLKKSRSLSAVNKIMTDQENWLASNASTPRTQVTAQAPVESETALTQSGSADSPAVDQSMVPVSVYPIEEEIDFSETTSQKASALPIVLVIAAIIVGAVLLTVYLRKRKNSQEEDVDEEENTFEAAGEEPVENIYDSFKRREEKVLAE